MRQSGHGFGRSKTCFGHTAREKLGKTSISREILGKTSISREILGKTSISREILGKTVQNILAKMKFTTNEANLDIFL